MMCPTLSKVQRQHVEFNPTNPEHIKAFASLCLGDRLGNIKQHPELRFALEVQYPDVRTMMFHKVGQFHLNSFPQ